MFSELRPSLPFIEGRGKVFCRGCLSPNLFSGLDLGELPIANELLWAKTDHLEKFPLCLSVCSDCGLGQVADVVTPERIFRDYRYLSSMSSTFLKHASDFVKQQIDSGMFTRSDWVLEIASNDGYLLKNFLPNEIKVIGIEPAENVAEISKSLGIHTISEFFSTRLAHQLLAENGYPRLIIANNVMAHVPDLIDFMGGLSVLCGPRTQISIENPSLTNILVDMQFDTIYHEHYSYLTAQAVGKLSIMNGLKLVKVEELSIHGGSNRYWLASADQNITEDESVQRMQTTEVSSGLFEPKEWANYSSKVAEILAGLLQWLSDRSENKKRIFGYGAAAKASTILNSMDVELDHIQAIADISLEKQTRFMPPHGTRIISPTELFSSNPTDILIFPWNIKSEIANYLRLNLENEVRLWCAIPEMHEINP